MTIPPITKEERDEIVGQLKRGAAPFNLRSAFLSYEAALKAAEARIRKLEDTLLDIEDAARAFQDDGDACKEQVVLRVRAALNNGEKR